MRVKSVPMELEAQEGSSTVSGTGIERCSSATALCVLFQSYVFILSYMYMCVRTSVHHMYVCVCGGGSLGDRKGMGCPGDEVTSRCELPEVSAGTSTPVLWKSSRSRLTSPKAVCSPK